VKLTSRGSIVVLTVLLSGTTSVFAQESGFQPLPGGLFGPTEDRTARHNLNFSFSIAESYDRDVPPDVRSFDPNDPMISGPSTMFMGHTTYHFESSSVQIRANGESVLRHYNQPAQFTPFSYTGDIDVVARLGGRTTLQADQIAAYSPSYLYGLFPSTGQGGPGEAIPPAPDYANSDVGSFTSRTTVALTQGLSPRSGVSATGEFRYANVGTATVRAVSSQAIGGEYSRNLALRTDVHIGYGYRTGTFGIGELQPGASAAEHHMLFGFKHSQQLSATRTLIFSADLGASVVTPSVSAARSDPRRQTLPSVDVVVAWPFAEGWQARGAFRRGVEYVPIVNEPMFANGFTVDLAGLLTSRLECAASARYSTGQSAFNRDAPAFDSYGADLQIRFAVSRTVAVYGGYLYYFYDFPPGALTPGIPPSLERNGIRVGLTLWVPAIRR
jgi:hypothetical protein